MISVLASSSFSSATCIKVRKINSLQSNVRKINSLQGVALQFHESSVLSFNKSGRCSQIVASSVPHNLGNIDLIKENSISPSFESVDASIQEREIPIYSWSNIMKKMGAVYMFTRPYQIKGAILAIISISLVPVQGISDLTPTFFIRLLKTIIPVVLSYIYMNGLNEIIDVEIDKINKPYLPLVSGEISLTEATAIISICSIASLLISAAINSLPLTIAIIMINFFGNAYSIDLPLLRWKNSAVLTAALSTSLFAIITPLCFFPHAQKYILGRPIMYIKPIFFSMAVIASFAIVIVVLKDIPDVKGDKEHGVRSASIIFGVEKVFWSCVYLLLATYGGAAIFGATSTVLATKIIGVMGHVIPAIILWVRAKSTDINDPNATLSFHLFIWKLLYAEYLLIPFIR